ncbi:zf-HC2 domain-containing protein [Lentzea sp. NPDC058450]|uniref:zf-HC2 domain-containing protein n=1 Tax=Lentzea sp. NPDC058450 TaxID=3346505 RepID=UPI0036607F4D
MVTRQPHHERAGHDQDPDDENRTVVDQEGPAGPCGDVAAYALGVLDPAEHVRFSRHLAGCEDCKRDAADFGVVAPVLRPVLRADPPVRQPCPIARSILLVAAGVVVAVAAVLSVVDSLSTHSADTVDVSTLIRAAPAGHEPFPLVEGL